MENFFKDKKIFVAGGSGFIGSNYLEALIERGAEVYTHIHWKDLQIPKVLQSQLKFVDNLDLENITECMIVLDKIKPEYIIHAGGKICHPSSVPTDIQVSIQNIKVTGNLLEASYKNGVKGFLDLNSSTGYPDRRYPIKEEEFWDDEPYKSYYGYGWMRRYREKLMEHVSRIAPEMKIALCRGTAVFGPYDNFDLKTCHVVPALIKRVISGENPLIVWGTPGVVRDFMYVKDVVDACLLVLEKGESMRPYNIGYGDTVTVGDIVQTIVKEHGVNPAIIYDESKPTTIPFRKVNTERLNNELGFKPKYTFQQGIKETINWYLSKIDLL